MKKYSYILAAVLLGFSFTSCQENLGSEPGNDKLPAVVVYKYAPSSEYDSDTDQRVRFVSNDKVTKATYLVEKVADKDAFIASQGESAYAEKVLSQGTAISFSNGVAETVVTGMAGDYAITAAASDGSNTTMRSVKFSGIPWDPNSSIEGTYVIGRSNIQNTLGASSFPAVLQRHETNPNMFRIKGAFGPGSKITINLMDKTDVDEDGEKYTFFRIPAQTTSFTYSSYGTVSVRDVGYWQGDDAYVTDYGYESGMYADGYCFLCIQYYVSAGSLGMSQYDVFIPNE